MKVRSNLILSAILAALMGGVSIAAAQSVKPSGNAAAIVDGQVISQSELETAVQTRLISLKSQEYNLKRQWLEDAINRLLLQKEASRRGITVELLTKREIEDRIHPPTEDQLKAIYDSAKDQYGQKTEMEALKQIESNLHQARINLRRTEFLKDLRSASNLQVFLEPPRIAVNAEGTRTRGPRNAPVTIVEFADFQCPFCGRTAGTIRQLEQKYPGQIRVVFRDFPLAFHENAANAAEAALCAQDQGKFWEMHDKLFASQASLKVPDLKKYGMEIGLNNSQFSQCLDSKKYSKKWEADRDEGSSYGVTATPTFFINGRMLAGAAPVDYFAQVIDEELERTGASRASASAAKPVAADRLDREPIR